MIEPVSRPAAAESRASDNLRGIFLMIVARIVFAVSDTFTKLLGEDMPASEVLCLRNGVALVVVFVMAWRLGGLRLGPALRDPVVMVRALFEALGAVAFVVALPFVMLGQSAVILLTVPIIVVALSALLYKEHVGWRRWTAIGVGFAGVVLVAGPFGARPSLYLLLTQVTAVLWAIRDLMTTRIVGRIPSVTVALVTTMVVGLVPLPGALLQDWHMPEGRVLLLLIGSGALAAIANFLYIDAMRIGAVAVVAPFRYTSALWATIAGFLVWGDLLDLLGAIGTALIIAAGLYTFFRELKLARLKRLA
jgi:drug/metabolite transporter (DMT)-like permease